MLISPDHSESVGTIFGKIIYLSIFFKKSHLLKKTHLEIIYLSIAYSSARRVSSVSLQLSRKIIFDRIFFSSEIQDAGFLSTKDF